MYHELLNYLRCPYSGSLLELVLLKKDKATNEIETGILVSHDGEFLYPIVNGIPRMLTDSMNIFYNDLKKHFEELPVDLVGAIEKYRHKNKLSNEVRHIQKSFSYEWSKVNNLDSAWGRDIGKRMKEFTVRLNLEEGAVNKIKILDAGCGHGEIELALLEKDVELFALDLSFSVDDLRNRINQLNKKPRAKIHLIQANVFNIPFQDNIFDIVFSDGVLHHTPNTFTGFKSIVSKLAIGGKCFIMVYSLDHKNLLEKIVIHSNSFIRKTTTHLPHKMLYILCTFLAPIHWLYVSSYNRYNNNFRYTSRTIKETRLSLFDGLSPKYDWHHSTNEVFKWFEKLGFVDIEKTFFNHSGIGVVGTLKQKFIQP